MYVTRFALEMTKCRVVNSQIQVKALHVKHRDFGELDSKEHSLI